MEDSCKISKINPIISVVVPAYNAEQFLSACLDSILSQTYENIEIVIVNDGSTDQTREIAEKYKELHMSKIKCVHLENGGVMKARLTGIKHATGEWIGFVDSDDAIEADMYERLIKNGLMYQADISHCGYQTVVNGGERIHYFYNTGRLVEQDTITGQKDLLAGSFVEPGLCNKLFHKKLFCNLLDDNHIPTDIKINEDLLMNYYLFKESNKSVYEDFCPYHYITRSTSATRSGFKPHKVLDPIRVRKIILDDVVSELKDEAWQKYLVRCLNACVALHDKKEWNEIYLNTKEILKNSREKWDVLTRNELFKVRLFLFAPTLYKIIFRIYEKYFQKKIYE